LHRNLEFIDYHDKNKWRQLISSLLKHQWKMTTNTHSPLSLTKRNSRLCTLLRAVLLPLHQVRKSVPQFERVVPPIKRTISTFGAFHYRIFPIIQKLVGQTKDPKDPFAIKCRKITTPGANRVTESSSFRTITKALGLNEMDLHGYRSFIESCPNVTNYVTIEDGTVPNGFVYYLTTN
jgi:hypothetical protein